MQLRHAGYEVVSTPDTMSALELMRGAPQPFDVVLVDSGLPQKSGIEFAAQVRQDTALASTRMILLAALDTEGGERALVERDFSASIGKPVRMRELVSVLSVVLSRPADTLQSRTVSAQEKLAAGPKPIRGQVMVVEDNIVNQKVAQRFLQRFGCEVAIANEGGEAIELFKSGHFDLILMDCQMPGMDGYIATQRIRSLESKAAGAQQPRRIPIVALTANAMQGQMERCMAAGMDDFLSKPIEVDRLRGILDAYIPLPGADTSELPGAAPSIQATTPR
jgi:CheY-like chemotaxis protein